MRERAAFRFITTGTLLGITLVSAGALGTAHAEASITISGGSLPSTGTHHMVIIGGFAVLLSAIGAGLSTLAHRPVR